MKDSWKRAPEILELELTNHCQLACPFCPHPVMSREKGFMSLDLIDKVGRELQHKAKRAILHQLGEPLLHPDWDKAVQIIAGKYGIQSTFSTNAVRLNDDVITKIVASKLYGITLSIDGTEAVYETLRKNANWDWVAGRVEKLLRARADAGAGPIMTIQIINMMEQKEIDSLRERFSPLLKDIGGVFIKDFATWTGDVIENIGNTAKPKKALRYRCNKPWKNITVQWNGDVSVCCRDYNGIAIMGNANEKSVIDIWQSPEYNEFRKGLRSHKFHNLCKNCEQ